MQSSKKRTITHTAIQSSSLTQPILHRAADGGGVWLCFSNRKEAVAYSNYVQRINPDIEGADFSVDFKAKSKTPFRFYLPRDYVNNELHQDIALSAQEFDFHSYDDGDFFIKSLRGDNLNFAHMFFDSITSPNAFYPLRQGIKLDWTVDGNGVHKRDGKKPQYTEEQKLGFSKSQSTSLSTRRHHSKVFGLNSREDKLVGAIICKHNVLLSNRQFIYDRGTVDRPYDKATYAEAKKYFKQKKRENALFQLKNLLNSKRL